jgi:hypothetical protein
MSRECYIEKNFNRQSMALINYMNMIVREYQSQGYVLTVRQLYYQLVARDVIENTLQSYKRTASLINDAKLAGLIDWDAIEDRTRAFVTGSHWTTGSSIIRGAAAGFRIDMWENQPQRVFVIIEKEALLGVLQKTCYELDVPILAARGYPSGTVLREFAQNHLLPAEACGQGVTILHLGDHDPSGIDMTRDIIDRMSLFTYGGVSEYNVQRLALNMDQIEELKPPENPAKSTDSRFAGYRKLFGTSSWELDALSPSFLNELIEDEILATVNEDQWDADKRRVAEIKMQLEDRAREQEALEGEQ